MTRLAHALFGITATAVVWRALEQAWVPGTIADPWVVAAVRGAVVFAAAAGTALSLAAGLIGGDDTRALRHDAASALVLFVLVEVLAFGGLSRDVVGLVVALAVLVRLGPPLVWAVRWGAPPLFVFALALAFYAPLTGWRAAASLPLGDQVFYLMSAERLAHGELDATIDPARFFQLLGIPSQPVDAQTHVIDAPAGPRLVQGYALPALLAPGWLLGGEVGATLVIALFAAWAAMQTWLLVGETMARDGPVPARAALAARAAWALTALCAPLALAAVHVYPNAVGAALVATGYRYAFTARDRRPFLAGALLGATAFLNPRDGLVLLALAPFVLRRPRPELVRGVAGAALLVVAAAVVSLVTFGIPLPYAGYLYGTAAAATIDPEPTWTFRFWIGLPAILFDRVFGVAGTAPWLFLAALGLVPALRAQRARLLPGAVAIGASLVLLSLFRLWEGGYAPPARYLADVLPLAAPFVAYGLLAACGLVLRAFAALAIGTSALMTLLLLAVPSDALNDAFDDKPQRLLTSAVGIDPLGWLPSFQPVTPDWWIGAYLRLVPAVLIVATLVWAGARGGFPMRAALTFRGPGWLAAFVAANAVALAWTAAAVSQGWVSGKGPVPAEIARWFLPLALAGAAVVSALAARYLPADRRRAFLLRHLALYAVVPLLMVTLARQVEERPAIAGAVFLFAVLAWALHALEGLWHAVPNLAERSAAWLLAAVCLVPFLALLPYERDVMPTASDEPHYLIIMQSLVGDHDLDLRNEYDAQTYRAYYPDRLPDRHVIDMGRAQYPIRDLGLPLAGALPFAVAGRTGVLALLALVGAALVAQLYGACRDLRIAPRPALLAAAAAGLTHPVLTYTTQVYPELLVALAFVLAARLLLPGRAAGLWRLAGASALVGALPWLSTRAWLIAVGVGLVVAYCALRPLAPAGGGRRLARALAGAAPFAALVLVMSYVNWRMFGVFIPSAGYYLIRDQQQVLAFTPQVGALGLLFDRVFGLIPRTPLYLVAALGIVPLWRRARNAEHAALALGWLLSFVYIADIAYWYATGAPPSRYLLAAMPFLVVLLGAGIETLGAAVAPHRAALARARSAVIALAWGLAAFSLFITFTFAVQPNIRYDDESRIRALGGVGELFNFVGNVIRPQPALFFPSLVRAEPIDLALALAWAAAAAALVWLSLRLGSAPRR